MQQTETFDASSLAKYPSVASALRYMAVPVSMLILFALAIVLRFHLLLLNGGLESDQIAWARQFYFGGISDSYIALRDALKAGLVEPWVYMPGYPALLAAFDLLGFHDLRSVRIAQTVLDAAAVGPLFYVARHLTRSDSLALLAAAIYAASPWWALGASYLLAESVVPALVICALAGMVWTREHPQIIPGWFMLGLLCAILPFFRSEMVLLAGPLVVWALLVGGPGRRLVAAAIVGVAFAAPVLAWCLRNYLVHGQFALVPPVQWYALWSGLGQVDNSFGYFVSDFRAQRLLESLGFGWHTPASHAYWKKEYLHALSEHPYHVLQTVLFRMKLILSDWESPSDPLRGLGGIVYRWFAWGTLLAMIGLLWKRRWPEAVIIAGPMLFALASLGFIYVEWRYVRYAGLTYVLGFPVLLALVAEIALGRSKLLDRFGFSRWLRTGMAAAGLAAIGACLVAERVSMTTAEYNTLLSMYPKPSETATPYRPDETIQSLSFEPAFPSVSVTIRPSGLEVEEGGQNPAYLATALLNAGSADGLLVRTRVKLARGALTIGVLSGDQRRFLNTQEMAGPVDSVQSPEFQTMVEPGSRIVLHSNRPTERGSKFEVQSLDISFLCFDKSLRFPFLYLIDRRSAPVSLCNRANSSR